MIRLTDFIRTTTHESFNNLSVQMNRVEQNTDLEYKDLWL